MYYRYIHQLIDRFSIFNFILPNTISNELYIEFVVYLKISELMDTIDKQEDLMRRSKRYDPRTKISNGS